MILVGRADRTPTNNTCFKSNVDLAQARANAVLEHVEALLGDRTHVLSLAGGAASPHKARAGDRGVEVHMCWRGRRGEDGVSGGEADGTVTDLTKEAGPSAGHAGG